MSKKNKETPVSAPVTTSPAAPAAEAASAQPVSIVDDVFDAVTAWAAQGLTAAKKGLEISARWLDGRAKVVGELATKLESSSRSTGGVTTTREQQSA